MKLEEIDRALSRGDRRAVEGLFSRIIHFTDVAECTVKLCLARMSRDAGDDEFHGRDVWIHGHVHHSLDYRIGTGRVVCNPLGYPGRADRIRPENPAFDPNFIVEL